MVTWVSQTLKRPLLGFYFFTNSEYHSAWVLLRLFFFPSFTASWRTINLFLVFPACCAFGVMKSTLGTGAEPIDLHCFPLLVIHPRRVLFGLHCPEHVKNGPSVVFKTDRQFVRNPEAHVICGCLCTLREVSVEGASSCFNSVCTGLQQWSLTGLIVSLCLTEIWRTFLSFKWVVIVWLSGCLWMQLFLFSQHHASIRIEKD